MAKQKVRKKQGQADSEPKQKYDVKVAPSGDVAKAVAVIQEIARAAAAHEVAKAAAAFHDVAKAAAAIQIDLAKAVASVQDVAKAVAVSDIAKSRAATDVAKAAAVSKLSRAAFPLRETDESFADLASLVSSTDNPRILDEIIEQLGQLNESYRGIATTASTIAKSARQRKASVTKKAKP